MGPDDALERDQQGRILALVWIVRSGAVGVGGSTPQESTWMENLNLAIVRAGFSPYWRKRGQSSGTMDAAFREAQDEAETGRAGAWATAPAYMRDKANGTTASSRDK